MDRPLVRRPVAITALAIACLVAVTALAWFQPWKLWVDQTVSEAPPGQAQTANPSADPTPSVAPVQPVDPAVLAQGRFISHEHTTTGTVRVLLSNGNRYLRLDDLDTSNGPLLKVWLTDVPVVEGEAGWRVFDDGHHIDLGALKGNKGSQNYSIPADVDLARYRSVTIWCERFHVSFGAAELH
jgi:hypothetical protein